MARIARRVGLATRADLEAGAERGQARDHRSVGPGRHEHPQITIHGAGQHRGAERRIAATRNGEGTGPVGPVDQTGAFGHREMDGESEQVPGLVGTGDVARLVLDPDIVLPEAKDFRRLGREAVRRDREAMAIDPGDRTIEVADELDVVAVRKTAGPRQFP